VEFEKIDGKIDRKKFSNNFSAVFPEKFLSNRHYIQ